MTEEFFFLRPLTDQRLAVGRRVLPNQAQAIFTSPPRIGLVITTYGAAPHVELALALRQKLYPDLPALVHDDASGQAGDLAAVCRKYGADFEVNSSRLGHEMGDVSGVIGGLRWAGERGIDLLVKMSRRWIPLVNWTTGLAELAVATQYGTYGRVCRRWRLPLRTECFAMYVGHWAAPEILDEMTRYMLTTLNSTWVERYLYDSAVKVYAMRCLANRQWEERNVRMTPRPAMGDWTFIPPDRQEKSDQQLWPEAGANAADYAAVARQTGLDYPPAAFAGIWSQGGA